MIVPSCRCHLSSEQRSSLEQTGDLVSASPRSLRVSLRLVKSSLLAEIHPQPRLRLYNLKISQDLKELVSATAGKVEILEMDVMNDASIDRGAKEIQKCGTTLSLLINNAGILEKEGGSISSADRSVWLRHFDVNAVSVVKTSQVSFIPNGTCRPFFPSSRNPPRQQL